MRLPPKLLDKIERLMGTVSHQRLRPAVKALSDRYRRPAGQAMAIGSDDERIAYLLVRMPATFAALSHALWEAKRQLMPPSGSASASENGVAIETALDLGAGPGTAGWAISEVFPEMRRLRLIERDVGLIGLGRQLCAASDSPALRQAEWVRCDLNGQFAEDGFDLVVASYSLGELPPAQYSRCLQQAWQRTRKLLVVVEPGTRAGFACIHQARSELIGLGATLLAPCPHRLTCPMAAGGDWCHFAARIERTAVHRRLKGGELGHEDEKFSYLASTPLKAFQPANLGLAGNPALQAGLPEHRIVRHPVYHSGFVELQLCSAEGLSKRVISRSEKAEYRAARSASWGDPWPLR